MLTWPLLTQPVVVAAGDTDQPTQDKAHKEYRIGIYDETYGIYDDILDRTHGDVGALQKALNLPSWMILAIQQRTRYESLSAFWQQGQVGSDQQLPQRTRFLFGIRDIWDPLRFVVEFQDARISLDDAGSVVTNRMVNEHDILQLHADLATENLWGTRLPSLLNVGRINMDMGRGRWVGRNHFRNTTNAFDGIHWRIGDERQWHVRTFFVEPVKRLATSMDPVFSKNKFWGIYAESRQVPWAHAAVHYFGDHDPSAGRDETMLGLRVFRPGGKGKIEYEVESTYEFGKTAVRDYFVPGEPGFTFQKQTLAHAHFAHFQHAEIGYTFDSPWRPQLLGRFDYASFGFDTLYGRRNFELMPTGIFGPLQRSNLLSPAYRLLVQPTDRVSLHVQHRFAWLADGRQEWVTSGLQDTTGSAGTYIGQIVETRGRWTMTGNIALQAGYAYFKFGGFPTHAPGHSDATDIHYTYIQTELLF
ncbi:MAG TPA: alginate export family protein [Nitrospira sp.]|nr:alginate export family protein [Nitrospira sp.]